MGESSPEHTPAIFYNFFVWASDQASCIQLTQVFKVLHTTLLTKKGFSIWLFIDLSQGGRHAAKRHKIFWECICRIRSCHLRYKMYCLWVDSFIIMTKQSKMIVFFWLVLFLLYITSYMQDEFVEQPGVLCCFSLLHVHIQVKHSTPSTGTCRFSWHYLSILRLSCSFFITCK